ncbi:MAG: lysylphosphatidylglycerol synthase transmembrane domain-containing protein [Chthoniobacterales bacterium]
MAKTKFVLRSLLSVALLAFVMSRISWRDLVAVLDRIDWRWACIAFVLTGTLIVALALRWQVFLRQQRIKLPFGETLSLTWAGQFFNSFLPGSTGGDVFKIYQVCRRASDRKLAAVASVVIDRLSALLALLVLAAIAFVIEPAPLRSLVGDKIVRLDPFWIAAGVILGIGILLLARSIIVARGWDQRLRRTIVATLQGIRPNAATVFALLLAFAIHLLNFLAVFFLARSLGVALTCFQVLLMMPVVLLLVMLPVTVNGHGLRELLLIAYFTQLGVHIAGRPDIAVPEVAVALSLLLVANDLLWSLPGGLQHLARERSGTKPKLAVSTT